MELVELFGVIRRRWISFIAFVVVGVVAGLLFGLLGAKKYTATSTIFFTAAPATASVSGTRFQQAQFVLAKMPSYVGLADSPDVLKPVISKLALSRTVSGLSAEVTATNPTGSTLMELSTLDSSASRSAKISTAVASQLGRYIERLESSNGSSAIVATVTREASVPSSPSEPRRTLDIVIGLLLGVLVGLGFAVARDRVKGGAVEPRTVRAPQHAPGQREEDRSWVPGL